MSLTLLIGIGLVGGVGAVGRFLLDGAIASRVGRSFPWGTLAVNISGAFLLGAVVAANLGADALRLAGTGMLGAFTTFSTWALESHRLGEDGQLRLDVANFLSASCSASAPLGWAVRSGRRCERGRPEADDLLRRA